jgi:hypothetical protein
MFIQWCIKGVRAQLKDDPAGTGLTDQQAKDIIDKDLGICCNWKRNQPNLTPPQVRQALTATNLHLHINQYSAISAKTPFISVSAGCVERRVLHKTNQIHTARQIALAFATRFFKEPGYLFRCWLIVGLKAAVAVEGVCEEVRELNTYRSWSAFQTEGEITAKIIIPANQIKRCEKWLIQNGRFVQPAGWPHHNTKFDDPEIVNSIREVL